MGLHCKYSRNTIVFCREALREIWTPSDNNVGKQDFVKYPGPPVDGSTISPTECLFEHKLNFRRSVRNTHFFEHSAAFSVLHFQARDTHAQWARETRGQGCLEEREGEQA